MNPKDFSGVDLTKKYLSATETEYLVRNLRTIQYELEHPRPYTRLDAAVDALFLLVGGGMFLWALVEFLFRQVCSLFA